MSINSNDTLLYEIKRLNETIYTVCIESPPPIVSDGLWGDHVNGKGPMKSFLPMFELQLIIIFALTQICSFLLKPLRLPQFLPQMIVSKFS